MSAPFATGKGVRLAPGGKVIGIGPFDFSFPSGSIVALLGPNGAGKSTLLAALMGEHVLAEGEIRLSPFAQPMARVTPRELSRHLAFVPQEHSVPWHLTVEDLLCVSSPTRGFLPVSTEAKERAREAAFALGLESLLDRSLDRLSPGERQRAHLALAMVRRARILLLDEPTNHLDPGGARRFWDWLDRCRKDTAMDVIVSTHDLDFVSRSAEWALGLREGNLVFQGRPSDPDIAGRIALLY